jgi:hypothetical protein
MAACTSTPPLSPYRAEALVPSLATACTAEGSAGAEAVPEGLAVVRSEGADLVMVAAGGCVLTIDPANGRTEPLAMRGALAAPAMLDAGSEGVALSSHSAGATLRIHLGETTTTEQLSGFQEPHGIRLLPGGGVLVAERSPGRVLRIGPSEESRPVTVIENLQGPVGLVVASAMTGYVTEREAGRITRFSLRDRRERPAPAGGHRARRGRPAVGRGDRSASHRRR